MLAHEDAAGSADEDAATAAVRVYDKLHAQLAPLVGTLGVQSLFIRSAKLARGEFAALAEITILDGSTKLREHLQARDPAVTADAAAALFGTLIALVATLIGERLTTQVLRNAWPMIEATGLKETDT